ncbi:MAG: hypothetical protein JNL72_00125 [Flavipsychrobacter sp.]|nr:hypothetical protein [Flavipsychrobacter sp.]
MITKLRITGLVLLFCTLCNPGMASQIWVASSRHKNILVTVNTDVFAMGISEYIARAAATFSKRMQLDDWNIVVEHIGWGAENLSLFERPYYIIYDYNFMGRHPNSSTPHKTIIIYRGSANVNLTECLKVVYHSLQHIHEHKPIQKRSLLHKYSTCDSCVQYLLWPGINVLTDSSFDTSITHKVYPGFGATLPGSKIDYYIADGKFHFYKPTGEINTPTGSYSAGLQYHETPGTYLFTINNLYDIINYDKDLLIFETTNTFYHFDKKHSFIEGPFHRNIFLHTTPYVPDTSGKLTYYSYIGRVPQYEGVVNTFDKKTKRIETDYLSQYWAFFKRENLPSLLFTQLKTSKTKVVKRENYKAYILLSIMAINALALFIYGRKRE